MKYGFLLKVGSRRIPTILVLTPVLELHRNKYPPCIQDGVAVRWLPPNSVRKILITARRNRMWSSAMHFAIGFFGYPFEGQYEQSITIEHKGVSSQSLRIIPTDPWPCQFNNTLAPDKTYVECNCYVHRYLTVSPPSCPNTDDKDKSGRSRWYVRRWVER